MKVGPLGRPRPGPPRDSRTRSRTGSREGSPTGVRAGAPALPGTAARTGRPPAPPGRRGLIGSYVELLADRPVRRFVGFGLLARMAITMLSLGVVLLISALTGSYALAGLVAGALVLAEAVGAPLIGRLADRRGQRQALWTVLPVHAVALTGLLLGTVRGQPAWQLIVAAAFAGASFPPIGSFVRSRWAHRLDSARQLQTAYSFESVLTELLFVVGPVLVTLLATRVHPAAGIVTALAATLAGGIGFALQRDSEPGPQRRTGRTGFVLFDPAVAIVTAVTAIACTGLGAIEVATVAFTSAEGARWAAGLVLAVLAAGSASGGLGYGALRWRMDLPLRYAVISTVLAVLLAPLAFLPSLGWLVALAFGCGLAIAPLLITGNMLVAHGAPRAALTEALTWMTTGLLAGTALGSWLAGHLIDTYGAHWGFAVTSAATVLSAVACWLGRGVLRRREIS